MDQERKTYTIGGQAFYQQPVTLGQARLLLARFKGYPLFELKLQDLVGLIGEQVSAILAIVLIEEGKTVADKFKLGPAGIAAFEQWLDVTAQPEEVAQVVRDFFDLKQMTRAMRCLPEAGPSAPSSSPAESTSSSSS